MTKNIFKSFKIIHNIVRKHGLYFPYYWIFGYFSQKKTTIIAGGYPCTGITQHVLQSMAENSNVPYALNNHKMLKKSKNIDPNLCRNKILNVELLDPKRSSSINQAATFARLLCLSSLY